MNVNVFWIHLPSFRPLRVDRRQKDDQPTATSCWVERLTA